MGQARQASGFGGQTSSGGEFRALAEHSPDSVARFDRELRYVYGNPAFQEAMGMAPERFLGRTHRELGVPADGAALWDAALQRVFESGMPEQVEYSYATARGERRFETRFIPEHDAEQGQVSTVLTLTRDITERWLADRDQCERRSRLETSEVRLKATLESCPLGIFVCDSQGNVTFSNHTLLAFIGMTDEEAQGLGWTARVHPDDVERVLSAWQAFVERDVPYDITYRFNTSFGLRQLRVKASALRTGGERSFVGAVEDITERMRLEEQLRQQQKMEVVGRLAGGVAHDFNNLLTVILNGIDLVKPSSSPQQRESLRHVELAAERAAALTFQLLAFGRKSALSPRAQDVNVLVSSQCDLLRRLLGEQVRLDTVLADRPAVAVVDSNTLGQAVMNLVVNARDASPHGGCISLRVELASLNESMAEVRQKRPGTYVRVSVRDEGPGIVSEHLPHIFEPFFTTKDVGSGTGLGLAIVYGIVEQHQGWVEVQTEPGHGSEFGIYLPAVTTPVEDEADAREAPPLGRNEVILLVEDEPAVRAMIRTSLEHSSYQVLEAPDPHAAKQLWRSRGGQVDLLLTDVVMPGHVSGRELADQLRADRPELPVLFMSGYGGQDLELARGMRFIQKPFPVRALAHVVRECLGR